MITIHIDEKVIDEHNSINLHIIKTIYKIKNDRLVIFLRGSVRCRYGFLTETCRMEGENHIYSSLLSTKDQKVNLSYIKRLEL